MLLLLLLLLLLLSLLLLLLLTKLTIKSYLQLISLKKTFQSKHYLHYSFRLKKRLNFD